MIGRFRDKNIVIMGLGLSGGGLAVAKWFFTQGARVTITDLKSHKELEPSIKDLTQFCAHYRLSHVSDRITSIEYVLGGHREEDFIHADLIVRNPDVKSTSPFLEIARQHGVPIENEASLFFLLTRKTPTIAITGTLGKSTTSSLIYHIARLHDSRSLFAGNIGTIPMFDILDDVIHREEKEDFHPLILELSNQHLETFAHHRIAPHIAVVTNVLRDHLNRYASFEEYSHIIKNIYTTQDANDYVVLNFDNDITREWGKAGVSGHVMWYSHERKDFGDGVFVCDRGGGIKEIIYRRGDNTETVCRVSDIALSGVHNLENTLAAIAVAKILEIPNTTIVSALREFQGLQGRLELIRMVNDCQIYNDTTATIPDATIAALRTLSPRNAKNIILITGGADKQLDYRPLAPIINRVVHSIILLSGTASPQLASELSGVRYKGRVEMANSMVEAVKKAWRHAREGDIILLSPGAGASGMFINTHDRGMQFKEAVAQIQEGSL